MSVIAVGLTRLETECEQDSIAGRPSRAQRKSDPTTPLLSAGLSLVRFVTGYTVDRLKKMKLFAMEV